MPFGGGRGRGRGGGGRGGGRGGFRGGGRRNFDFGPPSVVVEVGTFMHACESEMVVKSTHKDVPYFNAHMYLENKTKVGKIDEIFGAITDVSVVQCAVQCNAMQCDIVPYRTA